MNKERYFEICEYGETKGYVKSKSYDLAIAEWISTHGPGNYEIFAMVDPKIIKRLEGAN